MNKNVFKNKSNIIELCCLRVIDYYENSKKISDIY